MILMLPNGSLVVGLKRWCMAETEVFSCEINSGKIKFSEKTLFLKRY
jgi:hypothetical protein